MTPLLTAAMLIISDGFTLHQVYGTYEACSEALVTIDHDAVCVGSDDGLSSSPRPKNNPFYEVE